jgi:multicomponent Na+:H+ antiporter subunit G
MMLIDVLTIILLVMGAAFFLAGSVGLIRFPDVYTRLHALTKADNVGLGLVVVALSLQAEDWTVVGKLVFIWLLVLIAGSSVSYLIARLARQLSIKIWKA